MSLAFVNQRDKMKGFLFLDSTVIKADVHHLSQSSVAINRLFFVIVIDPIL